MEELLNIKWKSTRVETPPLKGEELNQQLKLLKHDWIIFEEKKLRKEFSFTNFNRALEFANLVGSLADELNHHPDIHISWGKCIVEIWTHRIDGLAIMDFVYSAKIERIFQDNFTQEN